MCRIHFFTRISTCNKSVAQVVSACSDEATCPSCLPYVKKYENLFLAFFSTFCIVHCRPIFTQKYSYIFVIQLLKVQVVDSVSVPRIHEIEFITTPKWSFSMGEELAKMKN